MSNACPICRASFYQKETYQCKMIKEAISYVNSIVNVILNVETDNDDENDKEATTRKQTTRERRSANQPSPDASFPDLDLTFFAEITNNNKDNNQKMKETPVSSRRKRESNESTFKEPKAINAKLKALADEDNSNGSSSCKSPRATQRGRSLSTQRNESSQVVGARARSSYKRQTQQKENKNERTQVAAVTTKAAKKNEKGETKLHLAVMNDDLDQVRELLSHESTDVNVKDNAGWTALVMLFLFLLFISYF